MASEYKWEAGGRRALLVVALVVAVAGCGERDTGGAAADESVGPVSGGTAVIALAGGPDSLNPLVFSSAVAGMITSEMHAGLTEMDGSLQYQPRLAHSWEIGPEGRWITYHLSPWNWSDGAALTAADVVMSYELFVDPAVGSPKRGRLGEVARVVALDSATVRYTFVRPQAAPLARSWHHILPSHVVASLAPETVANWPVGVAPLSSGEFVLETWDRSRSLSLVRNPRYPGTPALLARVVFKFLPEASTQIAALETGEVDLVDRVEPGAAQRLLAGGRTNIIRVGERRFYYLNWNLRNPALKDAATRRALSYAIDRELMLATLLKGYGSVANSPIPPALWNHHRSLAPILHDPGRARRLLENAGWEDHDGDGVVERDGQPFVLEILTRQGDPVRENGAVVLRANLAEVGVRANIRVMEFSAGLDRVRAGKYDTYFGLFNANLFGDPSAYVRSDALDRANFGAYSNSRVDSLINLATGMLHREDALPLWLAVQEELAADPPSAYLLYPDGLVAVSKRLQNAEPDLLSPINNLSRWWIKPSDRKYRTSE